MVTSSRSKSAPSTLMLNFNLTIGLIQSQGSAGENQGG